MDALSPFPTFHDRRVLVTEMMLNCRDSVGSKYTGLIKQCPCKTCVIKPYRTEIPVLCIFHSEIRFNPFKLQDIYKRGILRCIPFFPGYMFYRNDKVFKSLNSLISKISIFTFARSWKFDLVLLSLGHQIIVNSNLHARSNFFKRYLLMTIDLLKHALLQQKIYQCLDPFSLTLMDCISKPINSYVKRVVVYQGQRLGRKPHTRKPLDSIISRNFLIRN